jgi:molybdate transport system substrate-binding protein
MKFISLLLSGLVLGLATSQAQAQHGEPILVFAAASLSNALTEIGERYESETGDEVAFSFAASMTLARQIEASGGVDIFVAADPESMDYLAEKGLIASASRFDLLGNSLVLVAPADSDAALDVEPGFALAEALGGGRLAVAGTVAVPAGRYARAALTALGVWDSVAPLVAEGEDVRAALSFVARGEAPLGIVYATDAAAEPRVRIVSHFPASSHPPILYPVALTADARPEAARFVEYLMTGAARDIFEMAGFMVPIAPAP